MRSLIRLLVVIAITARLQHADADPKGEAQQHIDKATELFEANKAVEALEELKAAIALDPRPELLYAIGQAYSSLGQCDQATRFYDRFLATRPSSTAADLAKQAIVVCKDAPAPAPKPDVDLPPKPDPDAAPKPDPGGAPKPVDQPSKSDIAVHATTSWYSDKLGDVLVGLGVVSGIVAIFEYNAATSDRSQADATRNFQTFSDLIDSANSKRTIAIVVGGASAALIIGGVAHIILDDRSEKTVAVVPTRGGGAVTVGGRF